MMTTRGLGWFCLALIIGVAVSVDIAEGRGGKGGSGGSGGSGGRRHSPRIRTPTISR